MAALGRATSVACDMLAEVPATRWNIDDAPSELEAGVTRRARHGAFVDAPQLFDHARFGVSLAEAAAPYGIESFDSVLKPLWKGIRAHRGKTLAAFLKAIGFIIPLMDAMYANYYTREVMVILIREFATADEEMKKITLKVVKQCVATEGVEAAYVREEVMPEFFKHFWVRRMALDRRNYKALVETTLELALKTGASDVISKIVEDLKDESEPYRRMVMETITKVIEKLTALGLLVYAGTGLACMLLGGNFLDYDVLNHGILTENHFLPEGQHLGIFLVELGVGITVTAVMTMIFYAFAGRERVTS